MDRNRSCIITRSCVIIIINVELKPDLLAEIGFWILAEIAVAALRHVQWYHMIS